jgi:hypothetical protein
MKADIILTTTEEGNNSKFIEKKLGTVNVSRKTDMLVLFKKLALKHFGAKHNVRRDDNLFGWVAVDKEGDTITLK